MFLAFAHFIISSIYCEIFNVWFRKQTGKYLDNYFKQRISMKIAGFPFFLSIPKNFLSFLNKKNLVLIAVHLFITLYQIHRKQSQFKDFFHLHKNV